MVPFILHSLSASAADEGSQWVIPPDTFSVTRSDAEARVVEVGMPKPIGIAPEFRICKVSVRWQKDRWVPALREGCHPNLVEFVNDAAGRWKIEVPKAPGRDRELFEYWYVFPEVKGDPVRVFVRQAWEQHLVLKVPEIDVLEWSIKGRLFPEYPPAAIAQDTTSSVCDVKIDIAASGVPGQIQITDCDEVFRPDLLDNLQSWRFGGPELDGIPFPSGVTIGVSFVRNVESEGPIGKVELRFPPDADMGDRTRRREEVAVAEPEPPPMPTWPALFLVDHRSFAEVGVYDIRWPAPQGFEREVTCDVLFQVNSARRVWAWSEKSCDERVRPLVEDAAGKWSLVHGEIGEGERFARFRGTFVFPADGSHVRLRIPAEDLVTSPKELPEHIETYQLAQAIRSVPPKLPKGFATEVMDRQVRCEYDVRVDSRGRPGDIDVRSCPGGYGDYAVRAIEQWRWTPAAANGKAIDSHVTVRIRFEQPAPEGEAGANG